MLYPPSLSVLRPTKVRPGGHSCPETQCILAYMSCLTRCLWHSEELYTKLGQLHAVIFGFWWVYEGVAASSVLNKKSLLCQYMLDCNTFIVKISPGRWSSIPELKPVRLNVVKGHWRFCNFQINLRWICVQGIILSDYADRRKFVQRYPWKDMASSCPPPPQHYYWIIL